MAVFQISRIQIRRGKAASGTGIPQLASGEMAWAIDTQELYIGNGAVSEGAPAVGNTKVLTQNDLSASGNVLAILQHVYKPAGGIVTSTDANIPSYRSLQDRLDDTVSVLDFGAVGDGQLTDVNNITSGYTGTDNTAALQLAINQLYLNTTHASNNTGVVNRITLELPAGVYVTTRTLYVPSYATIVGAGAKNSIIFYNPVSTITGSTTNLSTLVTTTAATADMVGATITGTGIVSGTYISSVVVGVSVTLSSAATASGTGVTFTLVSAQPAIQFVNDLSTVSSNPSQVVVNSINNSGATTQPRYICMKSFGVETFTGKNAALQLDAVRNSVFENLNLVGYYANATTPTSVGIVLNNSSNTTACANNIFKNINISNFSYGVATFHDIIDNLFDNCTVTNAIKGVVLGYNVTANSVATGEYLSNQQYGARHTVIINCTFTHIKMQGVYIGLGYDNVVRDTKLVDVGSNGSGNVAGIQYPQVYFGTYGNRVTNIISDRPADLAITNITVPYIAEVAGHGDYTTANTQMVALNAPLYPVTCFRLPAPCAANGTAAGSIMYNIDYVYRSTTTSPGMTQFTRRGTITVSADVDNLSIQLSDDYDFAGSDPSKTKAQILDFSARFMSQTGTLYTGAFGQTLVGIEIRYANPLANDYGILTYSYKSLF